MRVPCTHFCPGEIALSRRDEVISEEQLGYDIVDAYHRTRQSVAILARSEPRDSTARRCNPPAFAFAIYRALLAPDDYQQGATVKIMFLHVPSAWLSMLCWALMTVAALGTLVWRHPLADVAMKTAAPIGAAFTLICLVTGALWGRPTWGTYWVWDARLTSVLVLFILYLGLIALWRAIDDPDRAAKAAAILTLVGAVDLPIIKFSVDWWNTLHQPASVFRLGGPTIAPALLMPLIVMSLAFTGLFLTLHVMAIRNEVLRRRIARVTMLAAAEGDRLAPELAARGA